ncbi:MAG: UDP-N-acetylglucosamine 1-carboxyvinyltransferase, partial [Candidatus Zixiibacteriota bacterium]
MDKFVINGGKKLNGSIKVEGSKNAALPIIAATILLKRGVSVLDNIPPLKDIFTIRKVLDFIGAKIEYDPKRMRMEIDCSKINDNVAPYDLM